METGLEAGQARMQRLAAEAAAAQALAQEHGADERDGGGAPGAQRMRRQDRKPFGTMEQKLYWPKRDGFHRHWFNDAPGRVSDALGAGYTHVKDASEKPVSRVVGKRDGGGALVAYLMEIPQEWFDEDMAARQENVDKTARDIHRGKAGPLGERERYVPSQGISVRDTSR